MKKKNKAKQQKPKTHAIIKRREPETLSLPNKIEEALIGGNLVNLLPEERLSLYKATCKSLRLNPLTNPFCYILLGGWNNDDKKLILYAAKNCTDQLRAIYGITTVPGSLRQWREDGMLKASISVRMRNGRIDSDIGVIPTEKYSSSRGTYKLTGVELANAEMHVVTKAKRRATLSICGLGGIVDESELDTMKVIGGTTPDGRIFEYKNTDERDGAPVVEISPAAIDGFKRNLKSPQENVRKAAEHGLRAAGVPESEWGLPEPPAQPKASQAVPAPPAAPAVREVELRTMIGDEFAVTGYLEDSEMTAFLADVAAKSFKANADGRIWWRMEDRYRSGFLTLCAKLIMKVTRTLPGTGV